PSPVLALSLPSLTLEVQAPASASIASTNFRDCLKTAPLPFVGNFVGRFPNPSGVSILRPFPKPRFLALGPALARDLFSLVVVLPPVSLPYGFCCTSTRS